MQKQSGAQKAMAIAKSIKLQYYELALLNLTLFVAIYIKDLPVLYIFGSFLLVRLAMAFLAFRVFRLAKVNDENPAYLLNQDTKDQLIELKKHASGYLKEAGEMFTGDKSINAVIYVLLAIYFALNFLPPSLEIILLFNFLFMWVSMKEVFCCCVSQAKNLPAVWKA